MMYKTLFRRIVSLVAVIAVVMCTAAAMTDVSETDWFYDDVTFVCENGIMQGESESEFKPDRVVTRAMAADALWRLEGCPEADGDGIAWARESGIYEGYGDGVSGENDSVTREQLSAFIHRYAEKKGYGDSVERHISGFADSDTVSDYAIEAVKWVVGKGIIKGKDDKMLEPQGTATAAELAAIIHRVYKLGFGYVDVAQKSEYSVTAGEYFRLLGRGEMKEEARTFNWPNSGFEFEFSGTEADIYADFSTNDEVEVNGSYFNMVVYDGDELVRVERMKLFGGWNTVYKQQSGDPERKKIMLVRSSEACRGTIAVSKVRCDAEPAATAPRERLIEYIGDSYTAGYANSPELSEHKWYCAQNTDNLNSFTGMVARHYGADNNVIAYQGKGVYANRALDALENTMSHQFMYSDIYTDGNAEGLNMSTKAEHNFADYKPQLVVVWLGTNDEAAPVDKETFKAAYKKLADNIREKYPDAHILNMALENSMYLDEITEAAESMDSKCHMLVLNKFTTTFSDHPDIAEDERITKQIIEKIDSIPDVWNESL